MVKIEVRGIKKRVGEKVRIRLVGLGWKRHVFSVCVVQTVVLGNSTGGGAIRLKEAPLRSGKKRHSS